MIIDKGYMTPEENTYIDAFLEIVSFYNVRVISGYD